MATSLNNSDIIKGNALQLWVGDSNPKCIGFATNHTFSMTVNSNDVAVKDAGDYPLSLPTNISWEVSCEYLYATTSMQDLLGYAKSKSQVTIKFAEVENYGVGGWQGGTQGPGNADELGIIGIEGAAWTAGKVIAEGKAIINTFTINSASGDLASISCTFKGNGAFTSVVDSQ